jgi:DNA-binding NtrC family response regulator
MASHTVIVVEDEHLILLATCDHLRACGFNVVEAESANAAIVLLEKRQGIDLVFSDIRRPGKTDGLYLTRWITENRPEIPVMIATAEQSRRAAINELCPAEPYVDNRVIDRIRRALAKKALQ